MFLFRLWLYRSLAELARAYNLLPPRNFYGNPVINVRVLGLRNVLRIWPFHSTVLPPVNVVGVLVDTCGCQAPVGVWGVCGVPFVVPSEAIHIVTRRCYSRLSQLTGLNAMLRNTFLSIALYQCPGGVSSSSGILTICLSFGGVIVVSLWS